MICKSRFAFASLLLLALAPTSVLAWGTQGHQVIALLAEQQLSSQARLEVTRLLALEPGETLASISTWADEHRSPQTAAWHYVNFPRESCNYESSRDCPDGKCVVEAINRQTQILQSATTDEKRLTALKYLVHLVGEVHQPLHAGYQDDKGGNTYQLQAFMKGSNLHAVWDTGLIKYSQEDTDSMSKRLVNKSAYFAELPWTAAEAAEESCNIVGLRGFYPGRLVDVDYVRQFTPVMEQRMAAGGGRLAALLNGIFRSN